MMLAKARNRKPFYVASLEEAIDAWELIRGDRGVSQVGNGLVLVDELTGEIVARISYNSRVWFSFPKIEA